jgi:hypothetical protein
MSQATITTSIVSPSKCDNTIEQCKTSCLSNEARIIASPISDLRETPMVERFKISIQVIGIKKRCRKCEPHFFQVSSMPYNDGKYDESVINDVVRDFVATNMKQTVSVIRICLDHVKVNNARGFTSTLWEPFSDKNVRYDISL